MNVRGCSFYSLRSTACVAAGDGKDLLGVFLPWLQALAFPRLTLPACVACRGLFLCAGRGSIPRPGRTE